MNQMPGKEKIFSRSLGLNLGSSAQPVRPRSLKNREWSELVGPNQSGPKRHRIIECTFSNYGTSGTVHEIGGLCFLPLNGFNQIIWVIMYNWLIILGVINMLVLFRRGTVAYFHYLYPENSATIALRASEESIINAPAHQHF
jgi:hypothetical protein